MKIVDAEKLVIRQLGPPLSEKGFKRRHATWYRYDKEISQVLAAEAGEHLLAVMFGAVVRRWNRTTHLDIGECHLQVGMSFLVPDYSHWLELRNYVVWESETDPRAREFVECVLYYGLPVLDSWRSLASVQEYVRSPNAVKSCVSKELRSMSSPGADGVA